MNHFCIYNITIVTVSFRNFPFFPEHWTSKSNKFHCAQISLYKTMIILLCCLVQLKIFFKIYLRIHITFLPPTEEVWKGMLNGCQEYINVLLQTILLYMYVYIQFMPGAVHFYLCRVFDQKDTIIILFIFS